jgi:translation initiation factor IF-3
LKNTSPFLVQDDKQIAVLDLVDEENNFFREVDTIDAIAKADEAGKDLVCFAEAGEDHRALCKILDFGKWKYQNDKKRKKNKKLSKHEIKEIRFSPQISDHDIDHKIKHAKEFIENGHELNFTMRLRRRVSKEVAKERMDAILEKCSDFTTVTNRKDEARFISVKLAKKKE